jgi:hypothetical protein
MSLTTQSESLPLVDATRLAMGCPLIFTGTFSGSAARSLSIAWSRQKAS